MTSRIVEVDDAGAVGVDDAGAGQCWTEEKDMQKSYVGQAGNESGRGIAPSKNMAESGSSDVEWKYAGAAYTTDHSVGRTSGPCLVGSSSHVAAFFVGPHPAGPIRPVGHPAANTPCAAAATNDCRRASAFPSGRHFAITNIVVAATSVSPCYVCPSVTSPSATYATDILVAFLLAPCSANHLIASGQLASASAVSSPFGRMAMAHHHRFTGSIPAASPCPLATASCASSHLAGCHHCAANTVGHSPSATGLFLGATAACCHHDHRNMLSSTILAQDQDTRAICWDQWFPEAARALVLQGAEILFYPTAIGSEPQNFEIDSREHWKRVMCGHAGANLVPLVASNRIGKETIETEHGDSTITFYGNSFIAGPTGELVALANDKDEAILTAEFNLDRIKNQRHSWGVFRDRRPDLYQALLTLDGSKKSSSTT
ncbi:N-carbamoylputrescine amidase [Platanthera zijinensis]|uniref:N-carbamoylputrescine amidase n=1 Tax=Platanthera zijinensis TaxID=2320716 RepID=A0AAP0B864_9ASPA